MPISCQVQACSCFLLIELRKAALLYCDQQSFALPRVFKALIPSVNGCAGPWPALCDETIAPVYADNLTQRFPTVLGLRHQAAEK